MTTEVNDDDFQEILAQTRHFVRTAVVPREQEILAEDRVPDDLREQAKKMGIRGGSAFRAIAGFGRHGVLHEEHFLELAADMTVEVEFVVTEAEAEGLLALLKKERISIFYARVPAEFGAIEGDR